MVQVPDLSALYRPSREDKRRDKSISHVITKWHIDDLDHKGDGGSKSVKHPAFNPEKGIYTVPCDGLYSLIVQIIPTDGGANVEGALQRRSEVSYALKLEDPSSPKKDDESDVIGIEYVDVGPVSLGEMMHLRAGAMICLEAMPHTVSRDSIRMKIELMQRKRKREPSPELSRKELKKRKKAKRKKRDNSESDSSSDWSDEFSSDSSSDELPHSKKNISQLAKSLKSAATTAKPEENCS